MIPTENPRKSESGMPRTKLRMGVRTRMRMKTKLYLRRRAKAGPLQGRGHDDAVGVQEEDAEEDARGQDGQERPVLVGRRRCLCADGVDDQKIHRPRIHGRDRTDGRYGLLEAAEEVAGHRGPGRVPEELEGQDHAPRHADDVEVHDLIAHDREGRGQDGGEEDKKDDDEGPQRELYAQEGQEVFPGRGLAARRRLGTKVVEQAAQDKREDERLEQEAHKHGGPAPAPAALAEEIKDEEV